MRFKVLLVLFAAFCFSATLLMALPSTAQDNPLPTPLAREQGTHSTLLRYFSVLKQGRVGLIHIIGVPPEQINFLGQELRFFSLPNYEGVFALVTAPLTQTPRDYPLTVRTASETLTTTISIVSGGFIQQQVLIFGDASNLINREIEDAELSQIFALASNVTPSAFWQNWGFHHPINAELTSPFGAQRTFNGFYETLHTGWDYQATIGKPMAASSSGTVVFSGRMPIRGNYVLIDHGWGIFSGYAHLSVSHVVQGQRVRSGQIIGQVGSTGRSSSAHAHIEFIVNGQWVDSRDFLEMPLPR